MRQHLSNKTRKKVEECAEGRCEYCRVHVEDSELSNYFNLTRLND